MALIDLGELPIEHREPGPIVVGRHGLQKPLLLYGRGVDGWRSNESATSVHFLPSSEISSR